MTLLRDAIAKAARECIQDALSKRRNNVMRAARDLGVNRTDLYKRMRKYGVTVRRRRSVGAIQELLTWSRVQ